MTVAARPPLGRIGALAILAVILSVLGIAPLVAYSGLIVSNNDALAEKAALLRRYRALSAGGPKPAGPASSALLYPEMPESQASALLQETVKSTASAAHLQVLGLQVLRSEPMPGATRIGVRVRASGDIAGLRSLIFAIESARPVLYPDNLQVQAHAMTADAAPGLLDIQLDVSGFKTEPQS